jgi:hypothetical protein
LLILLADKKADEKKMTEKSPAAINTTTPGSELENNVFFTTCANLFPVVRYLYNHS